MTLEEGLNELKKMKIVEGSKVKGKNNNSIVELISNPICFKKDIYANVFHLQNRSIIYVFSLFENGKIQVDKI